MYSKIVCIIMLFFILLITGCQKLSNDPGGSDTEPEVDNGIIYWGGDYDDKGQSVVQTFDGGYAVAGSKYSTTNLKDLVLAKFNSQLVYESDTTLGGLNESFNNLANDLVQLDDGGYVLVGTTSNGTDQDVWIARFNSSLSLTLQDTINGNYDDEAHSVWIDDNNGDYIVCGTTNDGNDDDITVWRFPRDLDGTFTVIYSETVDNDLDDAGYYAFQTEGDNGYAIVGKGWNNTTGFNVRLIRLASDLSETFNTVYTISGAASLSNDEGLFVQRTNDLGFVVVGNTYATGSDESNVFILRTDAAGVETSSQIIGNGNNDKAYCVRQLQGNNGFVIAGSTFSQESTGDDVWVIRLTEELSQQWSATFGGNGNDVATSISQTTDGGFILTGYTRSYGSDSEIMLLKLNADGTISTTNSN